MKARIMIIGPRGSGKSTIAARLEGRQEVLPQGIQDIRYGEYTMDMPSGYIETPFMYDYLIASAQDSAVVLFLADPTAKNEVYPPGFALSFTGIIAGVVTKADKADAAQLAQARKKLSYIGIQDSIIQVSAITGENMDALLACKKYCTVRY